MTPKEFIIWLRGFTKASNTFNVTPKQWDFICEELEKVRIEDELPTKALHQIVNPVTHTSDLIF